jgi:hypothetical protein
MCTESTDLPGAVCDKTKDGLDVCRWWYVISWDGEPSNSDNKHETMIFVHMHNMSNLNNNTQYAEIV